MPPLLSGRSQWALLDPMDIFFFQFQGVGRGGGSGGWWGTATDLSVASGVQELVAAVALETQLVPVLPQRRHLLSCT